MNNELFIYTVLSKKPNAEQLNQSDIDKLQKDFNVKLPQDYIDFLLKTNGGDIGFLDGEGEKLRYIMNKYIDGEEIFEPGVHLFDFYDMNLILYFLEDKENAPEYQELLDINLFPIGSDGNYAYEFFIGVGEDNFGKIYFYERFMFRITDETIHYVCSSFTELLHGFIDEESEVFKE